MSNYDQARNVVRRGARLLDRIRPSWIKDVSVERLNLASCEMCVLGQLYATDYYDGYRRGLAHLRRELEQALDANEDIAAKYGFDIGEVDAYDQLTQLWTNEIEARRRAARKVAA